MKIAHGACSGINILLTRLDLTTYDLDKLRTEDLYPASLAGLCACHRAK